MGRKNDKKNGFGEYFWNDGRRYEGNWENSERSGSGYFFGLMVIDLKEIGRMTREMDLESIFGMMVIDMKGTILMIHIMVMEHIIGQMAENLLEIM